MKWKAHISLEKTFNLLSLFWNFYQHMHFNAINQFNKIMRLELPFVSCGRAMHGPKCCGSWWKVICEHVCNSYSLSSLSIISFRLGTGNSEVRSAQNQPDPEPPQKQRAGARCYQERGASRQRKAEVNLWEALRSCKESSRDWGLWEVASGNISLAFQATDTYQTVTIHCYLTSGVLHWTNEGWRRARKVWKTLPMSRPPSTTPAQSGATC